MFTVTHGIHLHFAHHVRGHDGPCISLHGHTWKFELTLASRTLDAQGFVVDFDRMHDLLLLPTHALLDHALALGEQSYLENEGPLAQLGRNFVATRREIHGHEGERQAAHEGVLAGARNEFPGGIKLAVFPFVPTSERLAEWLFSLAAERFGDERVVVERARVYETLHPVESWAEYRNSAL